MADFLVTNSGKTRLLQEVYYTKGIIMKLSKPIFNLKLLLIFILGIIISFNVCANESNSLAIKSLDITSSNINFTKRGNYNEITCVGKVANKLNIPIKEVVFQVQYFNDSGDLVDSVTGYDDSYIVPANGEIAFRVSDTASRSLKEDYVSHKVIITSAKQDLPSAKNKRNFIIELLISWGPMLILIAVWLFCIRKYHGKNSPQNRIIEIQEKQYELIKKQNELFADLIEVIKNK